MYMDDLSHFRFGFRATGNQLLPPLPPLTDDG